MLVAYSAASVAALYTRYGVGLDCLSTYGAFGDAFGVTGRFRSTPFSFPDGSGNRPSPRQHPKEMLHAGKLVKEVFDSMPRRYTIEWLAGELNCDRSNVYNIFRRQAIDSHLLERLSIILNHNFFKDLSDGLDSRNN